MWWNGVIVLILIYAVLYLKDHAVIFKDSARQRDVKASVALFRSISTNLKCYELPESIDAHYFYLATEQFFYSRFTDKAYRQIAEAKEAFERDSSLANMYSIAIYRSHILHNLDQYENVSFDGYLMAWGNGYLLSPYPVVSANEPVLPLNPFMLESIGVHSFDSSDAFIEIPFAPDFKNMAAKEQVSRMFTEQEKNNRSEILRVRVKASITTTSVLVEGYLGANAHTESVLVLSDCDVKRI